MLESNEAAVIDGQKFQKFINFICWGEKLDTMLVSKTLKERKEKSMMHDPAKTLSCEISLALMLDIFSSKQVKEDTAYSITKLRKLISKNTNRQYGYDEGAQAVTLFDQVCLDFNALVILQFDDDVGDIAPWKAGPLAQCRNWNDMKVAVSKLLDDSRALAAAKSAKDSRQPGGGGSRNSNTNSRNYQGNGGGRQRNSRNGYQGGNGYNRNYYNNQSSGWDRRDDRRRDGYDNGRNGDRGNYQGRRDDRREDARGDRRDDRRGDQRQGDRRDDRREDNRDRRR